MTFCGCVIARPEGAKQSPYREARFLMGTLVEVEIHGAPREKVQAAAAKAFAAIQRIDELMSSYKETSEISLINRDGHLRPVPVSDETFFVLKRALEFSRLTDGAFDVTVGPLVRLWGFFRKEGYRVPTDTEIAATRAQCGWEKVILDVQNKTVRLGQEGMEIDLGGIAKGYAVDQALEALRRERVKRAKVNAGGQIGFLDFSRTGKKWEVGIEDPRHPDQISKWIEVGEEAVATSAATQNYFEVNGKRYGHILDPRTGWPAQSKVLSVTVVAPSGIDADALSTALFVLGPEKGIPLAKKLGAQAIYILEDENKNPT